MIKIYWILGIVVFIGGGYMIGNNYNATHYKAEDKQVTVASSKSDLEKIMEEENFKKETVLRARKVANDKKKAVEMERNKKALEAIESEYEAIRASEIELVGKEGATSLK